MHRRNFLISAAAGGVALAFGGFLRRGEALLSEGSFAKWKAAGYGDLVEVAAKNTGEKLLLLPKGFEYTVLGRAGEMMKDGRKTPRLHDGMAAFRVGDELRLVRNHEVNNRTPLDNAGIGSSNHYDPQAAGGTTTLVIDPKTNELITDFVSLSGTLTNCAGGATPWGSWISCEETTRGKTLHIDKVGARAGGFSQPHGYCFEVSAAANTNLPPVPLKAMGRFSHEAVAVDQRSGIVYQVEDSSPFSGFYRFLPNRRAHLADGGKLEMLAIKDKPNYNTRFGQRTGATFAANWVTIDNPDTELADTDEQAVFKQGAAKGAAHFSKLEGVFAANGRIYIVSSNGGDAEGGQIWVYEATTRDEGRLTLLFESPSRELLDMPDNISLHPKNNLLFICEDGNYGQLGPADNHVRILTPSGKIADFAKNIAPGFEAAEFAGVTFSPDGQTLFVNIQQAGVTLAIRGDWKNFAG
ncbi:MAG TPA: alkaline phosphatase PhoX [Pyrinomonadaceae bacterium]|nr:alkaline phosphatase PhoX [Pyrinomonadaceae bacterium]